MFPLIEEPGILPLIDKYLYHHWHKPTIKNLNVNPQFFSYLLENYTLYELFKFCNTKVFARYLLSQNSKAYINKQLKLASKFLLWNDINKLLDMGAHPRFAVMEFIKNNHINSIELFDKYVNDELMHNIRFSIKLMNYVYYNKNEILIKNEQLKNEILIKIRYVPNLNISDMIRYSNMDDEEIFKHIKEWYNQELPWYIPEYAVKYKRVKLCNLLLEHYPGKETIEWMIRGTVIKQLPDLYEYYSKFTEKFQLVSTAAQIGDLDLFKTTEEGYKEYEKALDFAIKNGHLHIVEYILEDITDNICPYHFETAFIYGHLDIIKYLVEYEEGYHYDDYLEYVNVEYERNDGTIDFEDPNKLAIENQHIDVIDYLVKLNTSKYRW